MWQFFGTVAVSAFGGTFFLHYLKNFLLKENRPFTWDWDGVIERGLITWAVISSVGIYFIPVVLLLKSLFRLFLIGAFENILKIDAPGTVPQKVKLKAELAFDLILSPAFAIFTGVVF